MDEIPNGAKREIIRQKIALYRQKYYSHQVDAQVARDIGGMDGLVETAKNNMADTQKFIDALEKLLKEVPGDAPQS